MDVKYVNYIQLYLFIFKLIIYVISINTHLTTTN